MYIIAEDQEDTIQNLIRNNLAIVYLSQRRNQRIRRDSIPGHAVTDRDREAAIIIWWMIFSLKIHDSMQKCLGDVIECLEVCSFLLLKLLKNHDICFRQ